LLMMVLLGTAGTIWGGILGAAIFVALSEVLSEVSDHWMFYLGLLIVLRVLLAGAETRALLRKLKIWRRGDG
jgi:branched-chain amino acid transport system permease protein